jgi:DNA-binding Lrp family transcriptional regulator
LEKALLSLTARQDIVFRTLAEELGISLSELVRRALDKYIEDMVEDGTLVRFGWRVGKESIDMETPKGMYQKLYDYVKSHPEGAVQILED